MFFFAFAPFDVFKKSDRETSESEKTDRIRSLKAHVVDLLQNGTYYLAFFFFYLSFYGLAYGLSPMVDMETKRLFGVCTLGLSVLLLAAFLVFRKTNPTVCRAFRSNSFVFSAVHFLILGFHMSVGGDFDATLFPNVALSIGSLALVAVADPTADRSRKRLAYGFFLGYSFLAFLAFFHLFFQTPFAATAIALLFAYSVAAFDVLPRFRPIAPFRTVSTYFGAAFSYACVVSAFAYALFYGNDAFVWSAFLGTAAFHAFLHAKYENYLSYFSVLAIVWYAYFSVVFPEPQSGFFPFFAFAFLLPAASVAAARFVRPVGRHDRHVLSAFALLHVFGSAVAYFPLFPERSVLEISLLFFGLSVILFSSYLAVRPGVRN